MKTIILSALITFATLAAYADDPFPLPCDDCTNSLPYTNTPALPTLYNQSDLIVRVIKITAPSIGVFWTNAGWVTNGDGKIQFGPSGLTDYEGDIHFFNQWLFTLGILNTTSNRMFNIVTTNRLGGGWNQVAYFSGAIDGTEKVVEVTGDSTGNGYFQASKFTDRFVRWSRAAVVGQTTGPACPGPFNGYGNYILPAPIWGWFQNTNTTTCFAQDGTGRTDTKIQWVTEFGEVGCSTGGFVTIPRFWQPAGFPPPAARFTIYYNGNVDTNAHPIVLGGFLEE